MATVNKRAYSSRVREEQAALTRARILNAAGDLFVSNGFARTTIRRIRCMPSSVLRRES